ncbi:hypothetical protein CU098_001268, partial [Rhizopus stolonifer]
KELLQFREICKEKGTKGEKLQSNIDELALNSIFFISSKHNKYTGIEESTYKSMIQELEEKYDVGEEVDLDELDEFQVKELRKMYKPPLLLSLNESCSPLSSRWNEDIFTKKFVTPLLSPFLRENKYVKQFGNDEESNGSKERRGTYGRKSDGGLKIVYKEHSQQVLHMEIKSPSIVSENQVHHPDFIKLGNLMKDEVDLMLKRDFPEDTPVFGILVGGNNLTTRYQK